MVTKETEAGKEGRKEPVVTVGKGASVAMSEKRARSILRVHYIDTYFGSLCRISSPVRRVRKGKSENGSQKVKLSHCTDHCGCE